MATFACRVQYLDDTDPFSSTNFPEPTRPPTFTFHINVPLDNQIGGVHRLLGAPHKVSVLRIKNAVASVNKPAGGVKTNEDLSTKQFQNKRNGLGM